MGIIFILFLYFLPSLIAFARGKKDPGVVVVVNLFFGWTLIGWVIALATAFGEAESKK